MRIIWFISVLTSASEESENSTSATESSASGGNEIVGEWHGVTANARAVYTFNADGIGTEFYDGETTDLTWKRTAAGVEITTDWGPYEITYEDGKLNDGDGFYAKKSGSGSGIEGDWYDPTGLSATVFHFDEGGEGSTDWGGFTWESDGTHIIVTYIKSGSSEILDYDGETLSDGESKYIRK